MDILGEQMRTINKLSAAFISKAKEPGRYGDGGGLYLQIAKGGSRSWLFCFMRAGKSRQMGLGSLHTFTLKQARERALDARQMLDAGKDPIEERKALQAAEKAATAKRLKFKDAAARYIKAHRAGWTPLNAKEWARSIALHVTPVIGDLNSDAIGTDDILRTLEPIWATKNKTATVVRGRIESILDWCKVRGYRQGENPARWKGHLDKLLPSRKKVANVVHHPAVAYDDVAGVISKIQENPYIEARALEFTILTTARTGAVRGARWSEINLKTNVWTIPAERMKAGKEHRIPLAPRILEILEKLPRDNSGFVFVGGTKLGALGPDAMIDCLQAIEGMANYTVHGFRSTFRDWAGDMTNFPREIAEAALAHTVGNDAEASYRRGDALEKRRKLMIAWANFCAPK